MTAAREVREANADLLSALESVLFVSREPLGVRELSQVLGVDERQVRALAARLADELSAEGRGVRVVEVAASFVMVSAPENRAYVERLADCPRWEQLSKAALETLAIVAYRQPVTRLDVEDIRGVNCEAVIETLLEKGLIQESGRREGLGRPILYTTTREFLVRFGLKSLDDLPPLPPENPGPHDHRLEVAAPTEQGRTTVRDNTE